MSKKRKPNQLRATAYHEAGHAVACWKMRMAIRKATVAPDDDSLGHVSRYPCPAFHPDYKTNPKTIVRLIDYVVMCFAGSEAEARLCGRRNNVGAQQDYSNAHGAASHLCGSDRSTEAFLRWGRLQAADMIGAEMIWMLIQAVAKSLLRETTLTGKQVRNVITGEVHKAAGVPRGDR